MLTLTSEQEQDIAAGRLCRDCGVPLSVIGPGYPVRCVPCDNLHHDSAAVAHPRLLRCPHCAHAWAPTVDQYPRLFVPGAHQVGCPACGRSYPILTAARYEFRSPGLEVQS